MASTPYKGALKAKRKPDLVAIANALDISGADDLRRDDLESAIKGHLQTHRNTLQDDLRFEGLYSSMDRSDKRAAAGDSESDNGSPQTPARTPRKHSQKGSRPSVGPNNSLPPMPQLPNGIQSIAAGEKAIADATHSLGHNLGARTKQSLDNIAGMFKNSSSGSASAANPASSAVNQVNAAVDDAVQDTQQASKKINRRLKTFLRNKSRALTKPLHNSFHRLRTTLSDSGHLLQLLIAIEALFLVGALLPTHYLRLGSENRAEAFFRKGAETVGGPRPHWAITVPDARGLVTFAFWQPLILWAVYTIAVPSLAAHLITFQRKSEPSAMTFALVRLGLLFALGAHASGAGQDIRHALPRTFGVAAGEPASYNSVTTATGGSLLSYVSSVPLDGPSQMVGTALVAGFALYEAVAGHGISRR